MSYEELFQQLADGLKAAGFENMNPPKGMGDQEARDWAMSNVAEPIAKAIHDGVKITIKGSATVSQINSLQDKAEGDVWGVKDSGYVVNPGQDPLSVSAGDLIVWNGEKWEIFLHLDLSGYVTEDRLNIVVSSLSAALASEAAARASADTALGERIDNEASARASADATLQGNIDAEASARESANDALDARIDGEETAREQADSELQAQIDAISSKSDVVDVVASYVELIAYDTSALGDNDVIKVLEDETHDDAESYYRWNAATETWGYIGSQGPFVTPSEMMTALNGKAPTNHASTATTYGVGDAAHYGHVKVDSALSASSTNPVQNKVVKVALDGKAPVVDGGYRTIDQDVSKGANLVVNGNGILGTNYNWPNFTFDATISKESPGAFKAAPSTYESSEYIKLDPSKRTYFECDVKRISPDWNGTFAMFPAFYDIDKLRMQAINYMWNPGSLATLTQDLKSGDTVVHLDSVANYNGSATYQRGFIVWNYTNSKGFTYPPETYSRNVYPSGNQGALYENENINTTNNTITLNAPWTGPTIPAGTKLSRRNSGGTFKYLGAINVSSDWQHSNGSLYGVDYSGGNVGAKFPPFTAFIKAGLIFFSVSGSTPRQFAFTNYAVREEPSTSDHLATAHNLKVNLASESAQSFDGSANAENIGVTGTLPITHGGTGNTNANAAANALINGLPLWSADVTDSTQIIRQDNAGTATFGRVPGSAMWNYIKSKVKTWLGVDIHDKIDDSHIASASTWNGKANANGSNANGSWGISITGNAATASSAGSISIEEIGITAVDLDNYTANDGRVHFYAWSNSYRGNVQNKPTDAVYTVEVSVHGIGNFGTYVIQKAYRRGSDEIYVRRRSDGGTAWSAWKRIVYGDGSNASGTWGISITGNAATATKAESRTFETNPASNEASSALYADNPADTSKKIGVFFNRDGHRGLWDTQKQQLVLDVDANGNVTLNGNSATASALSIPSKGNNTTPIYYNGNSGQFELCTPSSMSVGNATEVVDYGNTSLRIKIGYSGAALTSTSHLAAYTTVNGQNCIKDISPSNVTVGNATKWNGYNIVVGSLSTNANTISFL